ncbi:hypothetical protein EDC04DRAFT_2756734, partial [Pisolithus marmoratus]
MRTCSVLCVRLFTFLGSLPRCASDVIHPSYVDVLTSLYCIRLRRLDSPARDIVYTIDLLAREGVYEMVQRYSVSRYTVRVV